jgi:HEAT repeat protein
VTLAGHTGEAATVDAGLVDPNATVRAAALGAAARLGRLPLEARRAALADPDPVVRARAAELAAATGAGLVPALAGVLGDPDARVVEAACFALGEVGPDAEAAVAALAGVSADHDDPLCREAAVAALGAVGSPAGLPAILAAAAGDRPAVRRRAVLALAPFDGPEVDAALRRAGADRDWQVRQAAEDLATWEAGT